MDTEKKKAQPEEKELDLEPEQEYDKYLQKAREHRYEDEREFGESYEANNEQDFVEDDPGEYEEE